MHFLIKYNLFQKLGMVVLHICNIVFIILNRDINPYVHEERIKQRILKCQDAPL